MPTAIAERFADLSAAMEDIVDQATQPVLDRLWKWLKDTTPETISDWRVTRNLSTQPTWISALQEKEHRHLVLRPIGIWCPCQTTSVSRTEAGLFHAPVGGDGDDVGLRFSRVAAVVCRPVAPLLDQEHNG